jgi:DNA-nicking Smr family endonuclease
MSRRHTTEEERALFRKTVASGATIAAKPAQRRSSNRLVAKLDLHGLTEAMAHRTLARFLEAAAGRGVRRVLVVTGRSGVLKTQVPRWLAEAGFQRLVAKTEPAERRHGGEGALCVSLRKQS